MAVIEIAKIQVRRGQEQLTGVPRLDPGEFGWAEDTQNLYIGKRVSEGANNDENARILTDKDLRNIFDLLGLGGSGSVASTSTYRYRDDLDYAQFSSTTTTIAKKLDLFVSLSDFTQYPLEGDITNILQRAVNDLYSNPYLGTSTIRTLIIPAGDYVVSSVINLPPYSSIIGEGPGITTLTLTSNGTSLFRTVDGLGNNYTQIMQSDSDAARYISLSDMTLAYKEGNVNDTALISLDNVENPRIENVEFTTKGANITTSTYVGTGTGILARGNVGSETSGAACRNIQVTNCHFKNLGLGFAGAGVVSTIGLENNDFGYVSKGVFITGASPNSFIPTNTSIIRNRFTFVRGPAVHVNTNTNRSGLVSSENIFRYVGNGGTMPDQFVYSRSSPILRFDAPGNSSVNDRFNRQDQATTSTFFYNPLASGNSKISNNLTFNKVIAPSANDQPVIKIPLTGKEQLGIIEYQLSNNSMGRKGRLTVNISPDGFASVSDYYNYSEVVEGSSEQLVFSTGLGEIVYHNFVTITCSNFSALATNFEYTLDLTV